MELFKNGLNLAAKLNKFIHESQFLIIYSPYIKFETLKNLVGDSHNIKIVFVRWETKDIILGASDLEIYPFLKSKGIPLYRNQRIHLKAYVDNFNKCFLTTANISSRALNIPSYPNYNYEIGTIVDKLSLEDRLYFNSIENDSILITDSIYNQLLQQLPVKRKEFPVENDFELVFDAPDKNFLISALPMSFSIETLCKVYREKEISNEIELNCMIHDLALYNIPLGLSESELIERLRIAFFNHNFIISFLENLEINREIYFGSAKDWIQKNCTNVPLPKKWEITENIQILYRWIVELGNGRYAVDRPNHSERLFLS